jgi:hypothetical protein
LLIKTISLSCHTSVIDSTPTKPVFNISTWIDYKDNHFSMALTGLDISNPENIKVGERAGIVWDDKSPKPKQIEKLFKMTPGFLLFFSHFNHPTNNLSIELSSTDPNISKIKFCDYYNNQKPGKLDTNLKGTLAVIECDEDVEIKLSFALINEEVEADKKSIVGSIKKFSGEEVKSFFIEGSLTLNSHTKMMDDFTAIFKSSYGVYQSPKFLYYLRDSNPLGILGIGEILRNPEKFEEYKIAYLAYSKTI